MDEDEPVVLTKKPSLYKKRYDEDYEDDETVETSVEVVTEESDDETAEAQLAVDVYETNTEIVVKTMTAGVKKEELSIHLSREQVIIRGRRENEARAYQNNYHIQELYWGAFSRTIDLPEEVDIDEATATEHHGLITIKMPKFNKKRQATLKIQ